MARSLFDPNREEPMVPEPEPADKKVVVFTLVVLVLLLAMVIAVFAYFNIIIAPFLGPREIVAPPASTLQVPAAS